jgi:carbamoyltransferase
MSFSPTVKVDAINLFPSIAHVDGTARVQTVTRQQNDFLYNLLDKIGGPLINTSLNINGEPMITSIEQGLYILNSTSLDYLIVDDIIIKNKNR